MSVMGRVLSSVAAGHASKGGAAIRYGKDESHGKPRTILKALDETELSVYTKLMDSYENDPIREFTPNFAGVVVDTDQQGVESQYICIENLLHHFQQPKVMDVKIGVRTFQESECTNMKPRPDLYQRMVEMYPDVVLTEEEREAKAITKHRWMTVRDAETTIGQLACRIDGMAGYQSQKRIAIDEKITSIHSADDFCKCLQEFVDTAASNDGQEINDGWKAVQIAGKFRQQLAHLSQAIKESSFVAQHEFIGSSILFIADTTGHTGVYWIDFAKTNAVPAGVRLTHQSSWHMGNHEDGVAKGIKSLLDAFTQVRDDLIRHENNVDVKPQRRSASRASRPSHCDIALWSELNLGGAVRNPGSLVAPVLRVAEETVAAGNAAVANATTGAIDAGRTALHGVVAGVNAAAAGAAAAGAAAAGAATVGANAVGAAAAGAASTGAAVVEVVGRKSAEMNGAIAGALPRSRSGSRLGSRSNKGPQRRRLPCLCGGSAASRNDSP